jgi:hypothetical protein
MKYMIAKYKPRVNWGIGIGFLIQILAIYFSQEDNIFADLLYFFGMAFVFYGLTYYAKAKGYSPWFGALGVLGFIGFIILVFMKDKHKDGKE